MTTSFTSSTQTQPQSNKNIATATKSWPAIALSQEGHGRLQWLEHHTVSVVYTARPSKLVDNSDQ